MKVYAISDLHLSTSVEKPMDVFGDGWEDHFRKISEDWLSKVEEGDLVLLGGDMSWGMTVDEAKADFELVGKLPGIKIVGKGNHDYYWNSLNKMRENMPGFRFLQNNCFLVSNEGEVLERFCAQDKRARTQKSREDECRRVVVAGSRGWNLPSSDSSDADLKIFKNELNRLDLSLSAAKASMREGDVLVALLHYPPFDADYRESAVTSLLEKYGVRFALYGHLHGKGVRATKKVSKRGIDYFLTSCDLVSNKLVFVTEI